MRKMRRLFHLLYSCEQCVDCSKCSCSGAKKEDAGVAKDIADASKYLRKTFYDAKRREEEKKLEEA